MDGIQKSPIADKSSDQSNTLLASVLTVRPNKLLSIILSLGIASASVASENSGKSATSADAVTAFQNVVKNASDVIANEARKKSATRRSEMLAYFISHGDDENNITHLGIPRSFANYVCTGVGALRREHAALRVAADYGNAAAGIVAPGGDTFAEQWAKLRSRQSEIVELSGGKESAKQGEAFSACISEVLNAVPPKGVIASDVSDESIGAIIGAVEAIKSLFDGVAKLATDGLKALNEIESRKKLKSFVNSQHDKFQGLLGIDLRPETLDNSWKRRKAVALIKPYYRFTAMLKNTDPQLKPLAILDEAEKINEDLAKYDELVITTKPSSAVTAIAQAENTLHDMVNKDSVTSAAILAGMNAILEHVKTLNSDFNDIKGKYSDVEKSLK